MLPLPICPLRSAPITILSFFDNDLISYSNSSQNSSFSWSVHPTWGAYADTVFMLIVSINSVACQKFCLPPICCPSISLQQQLPLRVSLCCIHDGTSYSLLLSPFLRLVSWIHAISIFRLVLVSASSLLFLVIVPMLRNMTFILTLGSASFLIRQRCAGGSLRPLVAQLRRR